MYKIVDVISVRKNIITLVLDRDSKFDPLNTGEVDISGTIYKYIREHNLRWITINTTSEPQSFIGKELDFLKL